MSQVFPALYGTTVGTGILDGGLVGMSKVVPELVGIIGQSVAIPKHLCLEKVDRDEKWKR